MRYWLLVLIAALPLVGCRAPLNERMASVGHGVELSNEDHLVYRVYLPPGYDAGKRDYPLVVWFHGGFSNEYSWGRKGQLGEQLHARMEAGELEPFIVMSPTMGELDIIRGEAERALFDVAIPRVHAEYRTNGRTLCFGHSMGGLSALMLAFNNPGQFDAVVAASPFIFDTSPYDDPAEIERFSRKHPDSIFAGIFRKAARGRFTAEEFAAYDVFDKARTGRPAERFPLLVTCGTTDGYGLYPHNAELHQALKSGGFEHVWLPQPGVGHASFWHPAIYSFLELHAHPPTHAAAGGN